MSKAYIGIGSNLGDRQLNIDKALEKLKTRNNIQLNEVSPVIETEPVGDITQPKFLNACCEIDTTLYPDELLSALKSIEREMGRGKDSLPKKLSVEEQLMALEDGGSVKALLRDKQHALDNIKDENIWGPRIIDLDILLYDDIIMKGNNLIIPHKFLHERLFVLEPLSQIVPKLMHPVFKKPINDLLSECKAQSVPRSDRIAMSPIAHSQSDKPKSLLELICRLLKIPGPKLSETGISNEAH